MDKEDKRIDKFLTWMENFAVPILFPPYASAKLLEQNIDGRTFTNADKMLLDWQAIELKRVLKERDELKEQLKDTEDRLEQLRVTYDVLNEQYVNLLMKEEES